MTSNIGSPPPRPNSVATASVLVVVGSGVLLAALGVALAGGLRGARGWARAFLSWSRSPPSATRG